MYHDEQAHVSDKQGVGGAGLGSLSPGFSLSVVAKADQACRRPGLKVRVHTNNFPPT